LNPARDVVIKSSFPQLLWLEGLARERAWVLAKSSDLYKWAPKVCAKIKERIVAQMRHPKVAGIKINWHELKFLGYHAEGTVISGISLFPEKFMGAGKRLMEYVMALEIDHMDWEALTASTKLSRDDKARWAQTYGMEAERVLEPGEPENELTPEAIEAFPVSQPTAKEEKKAELIHDFVKAGGSTEQKRILNAAGQLEKTVPGEKP
jgi:hypothetical protein